MFSCGTNDLRVLSCFSARINSASRKVRRKGFGANRLVIGTAGIGPSFQRYCTYGPRCVRREHFSYITSLGPALLMVAPEGGVENSTLHVGAISPKRASRHNKFNFYIDLHRKRNLTSLLLALRDYFEGRAYWLTSTAGIPQ